MSDLLQGTESGAQSRGVHSDGHRLLGIYLRDHLGGASAGLSLVRRCRKAENDSSAASVLADIESQISEDRESLRALMSRLGVSESQFKKMLGSIVSAVSRLKSNGRFLRRSPSSQVVDLETLGGGIVTKRNLWLSLLGVTDRYPALDQAALHTLVERATSQFDRLQSLHDRAAAEAFR